MNAPNQPSALPGAGRRVLVVDDDSDIRLSLLTLLSEEGYLVEEAPDGRLALRRLRASRDPHVVLLDLNMPGMDGKALLRAIADDPFDDPFDALSARHAFILVTATDQRTLPLDVAALLTRLRITIVAKPFDITDLLAAVADAAARLPAR
jgi:CheY-like chemotaxis protein